MGASTANRFSKTKEAWKYDVSSLKIVSYGGGIATKEVIEALKNLFKNADIYVAYGNFFFFCIYQYYAVCLI